MPNQYTGPSSFQPSSPEMTQLGSIFPRDILSPSVFRTNSSSRATPRTPVASPLSRPKACGIQSAPNTRIGKIRKQRRSLPGAFPESILSRSLSPSQFSSDGPEPEPEKGSLIFGQLSLAPSHIDDRIRKRVREPLTPNQVLDGTKGYVYIFEAVNQPGIFKIGSTERTITERKEEIERTCGRQLIEHYGSELLQFAQRAEKLCHEMLELLSSSLPLLQVYKQHYWARCPPRRTVRVTIRCRSELRKFVNYIPPPTAL